MKKIKIFASSSITHAIAEMIEKAKEFGAVEFEFNGVTVQVEKDSNPALIYRDWERGMLRPSGTFIVRPHPPIKLSEEDAAEDVRLRAEIDERGAKRRAEYEAENAAKKEHLKKNASSVLALKDEAKWKSFVEGNTDGYGAACVNFAEQWGRLMQSKIESGAKIQGIAKESSFEADTVGLTGFMYGAAVSMLSQCWVYGEELRRWHNLDSQIGNEGEKANETGGTLNPALLRIG